MLKKKPDDNAAAPVLKLSSLPLAQGYRVPLEAYFWLLLAFIFSSGILLALFTEFPAVRLGAILSERFTALQLSALTLMFPIAFKLIFNALPFEALRARLHAPKERDYAGIEMLDIHHAVADFQPLYAHESADFFPRRSKGNDRGALSVLNGYVGESKQLSSAIYNRAGVYLLVGVLVAFSGLVFFYTMASRINAEATLMAVDTNSLAARVLSLLPSFGILFFIEFIAFFFLRQYRAAMDEFRYYEAVKRNREENLILLKMIAERGEAPDLFDLVKHSGFYSGPAKFAKGESTDIIESKKLQKDEMELLEKIVSLLGSSKK